METDWSTLRETAREVATRAYSPYSRLRVGAAALTSDGRVVSGCNVENVSFGVTLCAECGVVSALHAGRTSAAGDVPTLVALAVVAGDGRPLMPCGRCRQMLLEAGGPTLLIDADGGPITLDQLLPAAFSDDDLTTRRES
jgi:cytidine deaminase